MDLIKTINDFLSDNPWLNGLFLFLAVLSIIVSVILYIKSKKSRIPIYSIRSINLIRENIKKIKSIDIFYEGNKISDLSISKLAIWNAGKETIDKNDVASIDPLRIVLKNEAKILDAEILYQKNVANNFSLNIDKTKNEIGICFDYFDNEEGVVIQIYHTAVLNSEVEIKGQVKGTKSIVRKRVPTISRILFPLPSSIRRKITKEFSRRKLRIIVGFSFIIVPIVLSLIMLMLPESKNIESDSLIARVVMAFIITITYGGLGIFLLKRRIPKGFDVFEEEL